jgi:hypothetical protein
MLVPNCVYLPSEDARMRGRMFEARAAIEQRLLVPVEEDSLDHRELLAAQKAVELLALDYRSRNPRAASAM